MCFDLKPLIINTEPQKCLLRISITKRNLEENVYRSCLDLKWLVTIDGSCIIWVEMTRDELDNRNSQAFR